MFLIVSATRIDKGWFHRGTLLGRSLNNIPQGLRPELQITYSNKGSGVKGLPEIYNSAIDLADSEDTVLFIHDDVYLHDWFIIDRVNEALKYFDVVGIAGLSGKIHDVITRPPRPSWWQEQGSQYSGVVNFFDPEYIEPFYYGPTPALCQLLDGMFLACRVSSLRENDIRFDEQFRFHFYDLDFCLNARSKGLKIGTWPISVTHFSPGEFEAPEYNEVAERYLAKWPFICVNCPDHPYPEG